MTNNEVIAQLQDVKNRYEEYLTDEACDMAIEALEQTRWIPCSERLPEDEQLVIFSTKTGRVHQGKYHKDNSVNQWYSDIDKMRAWNNVVNAWMPLPEPYKGAD